MDKKTKIFFAAFFALIAIVITITFCKYFILKDYYIQAQADCDPTTEKCFISTCDPATDDTCSSDPAQQTTYYKLVTKKAYNIPLCDPNDENCKALECDPGENCKVEFCNESNIPDGEQCNDPVKYNAENPPTADNSDSSEDQSCDSADPTCSANVDNGGGVDTDSTAPDNSGQLDNSGNSNTDDNTGNTDNSASGASDNGTNP